MNADGVIALVWTTVSIALVVLIPRLRQKFLWLYVEYPLRKITGRPLSSPLRIARLEGELLPQDRSEHQ